jgi:hypothetical protein
VNVVANPRPTFSRLMRFRRRDQGHLPKSRWQNRRRSGAGGAGGAGGAVASSF